ncbi:hypothetical protein CBR64_11785 [Cellulosimicrobium cellulans]|uniref:Uncharacterized protein n=1 Tax=Cellulosimicrobium cellulans TaxID=1710 RepID=A0A1Y0HV71_CELCE|nr:hypothetical protein CBR64_11785 [Cellulosimicrobium cellulans]
MRRRHARTRHLHRVLRARGRRAPEHRRPRRLGRHGRHGHGDRQRTVRGRRRVTLPGSGPG